MSRTAATRLHCGDYTFDVVETKAQIIQAVRAFEENLFQELEPDRVMFDGIDLTKAFDGKSLTVPPTEISVLEEL